MVENDGSDLHLKVPSKPLIRQHGKLIEIPGSVPLTQEDTDRTLEAILTNHDKYVDFQKVGEVDFSYAVGDLARFRVNAFRQRGSTSLAMRAIPYEIKSFGELGLPPAVKALSEEERGVVLVTGTTGSGKSTTLAAMINHINQTESKHVITLEDPIEFLHKDKGSIIQQREVGEDTESFHRALRRILRQDPDVILIGEMRDEETVATGLSAAETGHLVFSTLHTLDAAETINRLIDFFPLNQNKQIRAMIASTLRGVISQRLVPTPNRQGRVAICEVMVTTGRIRDMIVDPEQTGKIDEVIADGAYYGMQTFDQALLAHYQQGNVTMEDALRAATSPHDFKLMVASRGVKPAVGPQHKPGVAPSQRPVMAPSTTPIRGTPPLVKPAPAAPNGGVTTKAAAVPAGVTIKPAPPSAPGNENFGMGAPVEAPIPPRPASRQN